MSWLRYSDDFTVDRAWDNISHQARWHYIAMVEECSRARRWNGRLPLSQARRASDVPDPDKCIDELADVGWVRVIADAAVVLTQIDEHIPPPGQRDENLRPRSRRNSAAYRQRKCEAGEHSKNCPAKTCPVKLARVSERVTADAGTGRDRTTHRERELNTVDGTEMHDDPWPRVAPPGGGSVA